MLLDPPVFFSSAPVPSEEIKTVPTSTKLSVGYGLFYLSSQHAVFPSQVGALQQTATSFSEKLDVPASIDIGGESFDIELDKKDGFFVCHPRWSLVGNGQDLYSAINDLKEEIDTVRESLEGLPAHELSEDAKDLLRFAMSTKH